MKFPIRQLTCAAIVGAFAFGVQAQTYSTGGGQPQGDTPKMTQGSDMSAKAEADYKAAKEACNAKTDAEKDTCLKQAKADYERMTGKKPSSMAGSQSPMSGSGATSAGGTGSAGGTSSTAGGQSGMSGGESSTGSTGSTGSAAGGAGSSAGGTAAGGGK